jgi:hypothetical protein
MKITESQLRQIITEELDQLIFENEDLSRWPELDETSYDPALKTAARAPELMAHQMRPVTRGAEAGAQLADPYIESGLVDPSWRPWAKRAGAAAQALGYDVPETNPYGEAARTGAETGAAFAEPVIHALGLDPDWETTARQAGAVTGMAMRGLYDYTPPPSGTTDPNAPDAPGPVPEEALEYPPRRVGWFDNPASLREKERIRQNYHRGTGS